MCLTIEYASGEATHARLKDAERFLAETEGHVLRKTRKGEEYGLDWPQVKSSE
jgi:hypothetical protein